MQRYRTQGQQDNATSDTGDSQFLGVAMIAPDKIPQGYVARAENVVFDNQVPETRPGKALPGWLNQILSNKLTPWSNIYGLNTFRDPNEREWVLIAADGVIYRAVENNAIDSLPVPKGVRISGPVTFLQAFNVVILQQGSRLPNLVMTDLLTGFVLQVADWDPTKAYTASAAPQAAYGDEVDVSSITTAGSMATVTTAARHEFKSGDRVYIYFETRPELTGAFAITVTGDETFTFSFEPAGGVVTSKSITSLTRTGGTATAVSAGHGLVTGRRVTISGANQPEYNGTFAVTVVDANTFTYAVSGTPATPATGAITWLPVVAASRQVKFYKVLADTAAGESPLTTPAKWQDVTAYVMPWGIGGIGLQNRIFTPFQKDLVAASNTLDYTNLMPQLDTLRVNQGDSDRLVALATYNKASFVALKSNSIYLLDNVVGDLSGITQERVPASYGCAARRCATIVGKDLWFLTGEPAVRSLTQTEHNEVLARDLPVSLPIEPLMRRINTQLIGGACATFAAGKYHLAVPLDDGRAIGAKLLYANLAEVGGSVQSIRVTPGVQYYYGSSDSRHRLYDGATLLTPNSYFTTNNSTLQLYPLRPSKGSSYIWLQATYVGNNAILTYNTKTEAWEGVHQGEGIAPVEWARITMDGKERAFFASQDGFVNLWGEGRLDVAQDNTQASGVNLKAIESYVVSRGYDYQLAGLKRFTAARVAVSTWNPSYTITAKFQGANDEIELAAAVTKSPTKYFDPWDRPAFVPDNRNGDHGEPGREDYSVVLGESDSLQISSDGEVHVEQDQDSQEMENISHGRRDRVCQVTVRNTQGYLRVNAIELTGEPGAREAGEHQ